MTEDKWLSKPQYSQAHALNEAIAYPQEKLHPLQRKQRDQQRKAHERHQKAVRARLNAQQLDALPAAQGKRALPKIKTLLKGACRASAAAVIGGSKTDGSRLNRAVKSYPVWPKAGR